MTRLIQGATVNIRCTTEQWKSENVLSDIATTRLRLQPDYQRYYIWERKKEQAFIDSMLRGYPIPPVWIWRHKVRRKATYEVIDGQQRLNCIKRFIGNEFEYRQPKNSASGLGDFSAFNGSFFDKRLVGVNQKPFTPDMRDQLLGYTIPAIIVEVDSRDVIIDIFRRLNKSATNLTPQELRNAFYTGEFKSFVYDRVAQLKSDTYWGKDNRVFRARQVDRMGDQQHLSEIVVAMCEGSAQDKSDKLDHYYEQYDARFSKLGEVGARLTKTLTTIKRILPGPSRFTQNVSDFYALALVIDQVQCGALVDWGDKENIKHARTSLVTFESAYAKFLDGRGKHATGRSLFEDYRETIVGRQREKEMRDLRISILNNLIEPSLKRIRKDRRRAFTQEQKLFIWQQAQKKVCAICKQSVNESEYEPDHIISWSKGGRTSIANGRIAHRSCNRSRKAG